MRRVAVLASTVAKSILPAASRTFLETEFGEEEMLIQNPAGWS
jgi:hypothetical protein